MKRKKLEMKQQIAYAIVGDGDEGYKYFGETFDTDPKYWESLNYRAVPVHVDMDDELREFYFY